MECFQVKNDVDKLLLKVWQAKDSTEHRCPSGLRSRTQDAMWQHARVQIPLCAFFVFKKHDKKHSIKLLLSNKYIS